MRNVISLNENWTLTFPKGERPAEAVTLPHTWNAVDGMDGNGSYLRTTGVYTRTFTAPKQPLAGGRTYIEVLAAALSATVKVNGTVATTHEGGYSIFRADVTDLCHDGENELTIEVSNEDTPSMYPSSADFTFYVSLSGIFAARAPARRTLQFRECCGLPMVNRYHGTLTPPRIAPSRPFKEKTEVSLYAASASSQAAAPHDCYSSPEVAHSLSGGLGVGSCVASQKRKDPQH